ncbi:hypothetical protein ACB040_12865 [Aeromonas sp. S11(2024)]|uniref:hypothetical protein n=1 Tax=unclassified Aeromonas TaxID=257493 RepID=UPI003529481F
MLKYMESGKVIKRVVVHNYKNRITNNVGGADDHAAPAVIYDERRNRILVATAYHGDPMYIYEVDIDKAVVSLVSEWNGLYTYPRFIKHDKNVILTARNQSKAYEGDFVYRSSIDGFKNEHVIAHSGKNSVIYAGTPDIKKDDLYFTYSTHSYQEKRLKGFNISRYNLKNNETISTCDLSQHIDRDYFSNRPTGLKIVGNEIFFGTSYFLAPVSYSSAESENYSGVNTVKVFKANLNDCESIDVLHVNKNVSMPYYDVDVAINNKGKYLYFDEKNAVTNDGYYGCFNQNKMMYPNFVDNIGVIYATMNARYSIRNFNNSIYGCLIQ